MPPLDRLRGAGTRSTSHARTPSGLDQMSEASRVPLALQESALRVRVHVYIGSTLCMMYVADLALVPHTVRASRPLVSIRGREAV